MVTEDSAAKNLHRKGQTWEVARRAYLEGVYGCFDSCTQAGISVLSLREHPGYAFQQAACLHCTMLTCALTSRLPAAAAKQPAIACDE